MTPQSLLKHASRPAVRWTALTTPALTGLLALFAISAPQTNLQAADVTSLQASAYRNSIAQDNVGRQVVEIREKLGLLLQDFYQNDVESDEARTAIEIANMLHSLSMEQIRPLVANLKDAGNRQDLEAILASLTQSSQAQKKIQVELKSLEARLDGQIGQATLSRRFNNLVLRQAGNLRQTADLLQKDQANQSSARSTVSLLQSEQSALRDELSIALNDLTEVPENSAQATLYASVDTLVRTHKLPEQAEAAATFAQDKEFMNSLKAQKKLLAGLRAIATALQPEQSPKERLLSMQSTLDRLSTEQSHLASDLKTADKSELAAIREKQAALLDEANVLRSDLSAMNGRAGKKLEEAAKSMDEAAKSMAQMKKATPREKAAASKSQEAAADQLSAAREALDQQLAALDTRPASNTQALEDKIAQLKSLEDAVSEIAEQQAALGDKPTRQQQQPIANQTADLQNKAQPLSEDAAAALNEAFMDMQRQNPAEAQEALLQANASLQKEIQALEKLRDADEVLNELAALKDAIQETASQQDALGKEPTPEAQQAVASQTAELQEKAEALNPSAAARLSDALAQMEAQQASAAKMSLEQAAELLEEEMEQLAQSRAMEEALADLNALKNQISDAAEKQRSLSKNSSPEQQAALTEEVASLQEAAFPLSPPAAGQLGAALAQMPAAPAQAAQSLEQAARSVAEQIQQMEQLQNQMEQMQSLAHSLEAAKKQASDAAEQLAQQQASGGDLGAPAEKLEEALNQLRDPYQMAEASGLKDTAEALKKAGQNLKKASQSAAQNQAAEAAQTSEAAQSALQEALDSLEQAMATAQQQAESTAPSMAQKPSSSPSGSKKPSGKESTAEESSNSSSQDNFVDNGPLGFVLGQANEGLRPEQREAAMLLNKQSAPVEYQALVQNYLRNLAEGVSPVESKP